MFFQSISLFLLSSVVVLLQQSSSVFSFSHVATRRRGFVTLKNNAEQDIDRRAVLKGAGVGMGLLVGSQLTAKRVNANLPPLPPPSETPKTILITGASSGIGLSAATKLAARGHKVHVCARSLSRAKGTAEKVGACGYYECDLSSLASVKSFLSKWGSEPIDVLCLNAGVAMNTGDNKNVKYTKEGFEETIGVNHLAHFYMAEKLLGNLERSKLQHPRLVVTASSVHDPSTNGGNVGPGAGLGDLKGWTDFLETDRRFDMVDGSPFNADKSYKDSKLLNVLFTQELSRRLAAKKSKVTVNCFSPGLIPSSGLFRAQNPIFTTLFNFIAVKVLGVGTTVDVGGDCMSYMVESEDLEGTSGGFYATPPGEPNSLFSPRTISKEASDQGKAARVYALSEELLTKVGYS